VNNFDFKRDAATFHLHSGTICFVTAVNGRVTGAVFIGDGNLALSPPGFERDMLKYLTREDEFSENFSHLVLRFTDASYDELKKAGTPGATGCDAAPLKDSQHDMRHKLKDNLDSRILEDVLSPSLSGLFVAFIHGERYNNEELFTIDPRRARDQVSFITYDVDKRGDWALFPASGERKRGTIGHAIHIDHQQLDTTLEKNGNLIGHAKTDFVAQLDRRKRAVPRQNPDGGK
jgi:hypothetical protein